MSSNIQFQGILRAVGPSFQNMDNRAKQNMQVQEIYSDKEMRLLEIFHLNLFKNVLEKSHQ